MASVTLAVGQQVQLSVSGNITGTAVALDNVGKPAWTQTDATKASLTPSLDGKTCLLKGLAAGSTTVTCTVATSGGNLTDTCSVTVNAAPSGQANDIDIAVGTVVAATGLN